MKTITYNPETHVLVPREPTQAMCSAALAFENNKPLNEWGMIVSNTYEETYSAMLAAEELAAKRLEEIAKYRDAPVVAWRTWRETKIYGHWEYRHDELELNDDDWQELIVKPGEDCESVR